MTSRSHTVDVELVTGTIAVEQVGQADPLLLVHPEDGTVFLGPLIGALAEHHTVHVLHLPGWGITQGSTDVSGVDDLALLVAEYAARVGAAVPAVGVSFGAWVLAEAAVFAPAAFSSLVLAAPIGIKTNDVTERSFVDLWATHPDELRRSLYGDASRMPDLRELDESEFLRLAQANEAVALHGWAPYLHDPKLPHRLARVDVPTLVVTGGDDRFVLQPDYGARWVELIGGPARHVELDGVGHRLEEEAPAELARHVVEFLDAS